MAVVKSNVVLEGSGPVAVSKPEVAAMEAIGAGDLRIHVLLNKPEMILVEDSSKDETNALIFTVNIFTIYLFRHHCEQSQY